MSPQTNLTGNGLTHRLQWHSTLPVNLSSLAKPTTVTVASFTKEVNRRLAKRPLIFNGRLANPGLTSLVKEASVPQ